MAIDHEDRRIIDADRSFPDSRSWHLGKWVGREEFKPEWLQQKEQAEQLTNEIATNPVKKDSAET